MKHPARKYTYLEYKQSHMDSDSILDAAGHLETKEMHTTKQGGEWI